MPKGVEAGSRFPELLVSPSQSLDDKGGKRFSLKRVLVGVAIGAVTLPALTLGLFTVTGGQFSYLPSEVPGVIAVLASQAVLGGTIGGYLAAKRR